MVNRDHLFHYCVVVAMFALLLTSPALAQFGTQTTEELASLSEPSIALTVKMAEFGDPGLVLDNCVYLDASTTPTSTVRRADIRLTSCQGKAAGTQVTDTDTLELGQASVTQGIPTLVYADVDANGAYGDGDWVYLQSDNQSQLMTSTGNDEWAIRLTPSGSQAAGTFVAVGHDDHTTYGSSTLLWSASSTAKTFDADEGESILLIPASPGQEKGTSVPAFSILLLGPMPSTGPPADFDPVEEETEPVEEEPVPDSVQDGNESDLDSLALVGVIAVLVAATAVGVTVLVRVMRGKRARTRKLRRRRFRDEVEIQRRRQNTEIARRRTPTLSGRPYPEKVPEVISDAEETDMTHLEVEEGLDEFEEVDEMDGGDELRFEGSVESEIDLDEDWGESSFGMFANRATAPEPRHVNLVLEGGDGDAWDRFTPLPKAQLMHLIVDIGSFRHDGYIDLEDIGPPVDDVLARSPRGHHLDVVASSSDFTVQPRTHRMFLPQYGNAWVCTCPPDQDGPCPGHDAPSPLAIDVTTPDRAGAAQMRVSVYHRNNLLQSFILSTRVGGRTNKKKPVTQTTLDYTLTADFTDVDTFTDVAVNLVHNETHGSHRLVVHSQSKEAKVFDWDEAQVASAIRGAREGLFHVHIDGDPQDPDSWQSLFGADQSKDRDALVKDLRDLAGFGTALYNLMYQQDPDGMTDVADRLSAGPSRIQAARTTGSTLYFPWGLVYDLPNDGDGDSLSLCPMLDEWDAKWKGKELPLDCPHGCPQDRTYGRLCPYGFWGIRHLVEEPPSLPQGRSLSLTVTAVNSPPQCVMALSRRLDANEKTRHVERMQDLLLDHDVDVLDDDVSILDGLGRPYLEMLYFYCHGGAEDKHGARTPYLDVGLDQRIHASLLLGHKRGIWAKDHWAQTGPLVFLNGCETGAMIPGDLTRLVDAFVVMRAAGVIATEVPLEQGVAGQVAEAFVASFQGNRVGNAMKAMRLALLGKGNLMGLAYTAHCSSELRLKVAT